MPHAIVCHQPGLLDGPLQHNNVWYQVHQDGCLNPQPAPDEFQRMRQFTSTFCTRDITEARAAQLEWPGWEQDPDDEDEAEAEEPESEEEEVDPADLSWGDLKAYAKDRGITATTKVEILAELADL